MKFSIDEIQFSPNYQLVFSIKLSTNNCQFVKSFSTPKTWSDSCFGKLIGRSRQKCQYKCFYVDFDTRFSSQLAASFHRAAPSRTLLYQQKRTHCQHAGLENYLRVLIDQTRQKLPLVLTVIDIRILNSPKGPVSPLSNLAGYYTQRGSNKHIIMLKCLVETLENFSFRFF